MTNLSQDELARRAYICFKTIAILGFCVTQHYSHDKDTMIALRLAARLMELYEGKVYSTEQVSNELEFLIAELERGT